MPTVAYIGKHSKDRVLSVYLPKRVYVDEGQGIEPIQTIVRLHAKRLAAVGPNQCVFVSLTCSFVYERYDFDLEIFESILHESSAQPKLNVALPDEYHFPYEFRLPDGLPASSTLNPGFVYYGRPIGVSYEVSAFIADRTAVVGARRPRNSRAVIRFRKAAYYPILRQIQPTQTGTKTFLGSSKPLTLTVTLDSEIYYVGQPITLQVRIHNESSHDVHAIRISAKQVVRARFSNNDEEKYKCQVALLETDRACPIKKNAEYVQRFAVTPELLPTETYHIAQRGRVSSGDAACLAASTRPEEGSVGRRGVQISYYLNVHAVLSMNKDLIVKLPFILSGNERKEDVAPANQQNADDDEDDDAGVDVELLVQQLTSLGFTAGAANKALANNRGNFEKAFDDLRRDFPDVRVSAEKATAARAAATPAPAAPLAAAAAATGGAAVVGATAAVAVTAPKASKKEALLISFDDDEPEPATPSGSAAAGAAAGAAGTSAGLPLLDDIVRATEVVNRTHSDLLIAQVSSSKGLLAVVPLAADETAALLTALGAVTVSTQEFVSDVTSHDSSEVYSSALETANQLRTIATSMRNVASRATPLNAQQDVLNAVGDVLDKYLLLFQAARDQLRDPRNADARVRTRNLADSVANALAALQSKLPGQRDVELAVSTISAAVAQLEQNLPTGVPPAQLLLALEAVNTEAYQLSQAFQRLGSAAAQSTAEQLSAVAVDYRTILPHLLSAGKTVLAGIVNEDARRKYLALLQQGGTTNGQLLQAAKMLNTAPTDTQAKRALDAAAREVIESMKKLLIATNALQVVPDAGQTQLQAVVGNTPTGTPAPAAAVAVPVTAASRLAAAPDPARRDSFDDFIVRRVGAQAKSATAGAAGGAAAPAGRSPIAWQLKRVAEDLDASATAIQAVDSGTAHFTIADDGSLQPGTSASIVLDHLASLAKKAHRQSLLATERQNEISILAQASFGDNATDASNRWSQALAVAAEELSASVKPLVPLARDIDSATAAQIATLPAALDAVSGAATRLLAAARHDDGPTTQVWHGLQEATRLVVAAATVLSDAAKAELAVPAADVLQGKTAPAAEKTLTPAQFEQRLRLHRIEVKLQQELDQRFTGRRKSNMPNLRTPSGPAPIGEGDADSDDEATSA